MPVIKVLLDENGEILGTAHMDAGSAGTGPPQVLTPVARPGQRVVEVTVDENVARLEPDALHAALKADHLR